MYLSEVHYGIEPIEHPFHGAHRLYRLEEPEGPSLCGVQETIDTSHTLLPSYFQLRRVNVQIPLTSLVFNDSYMLLF